jgi:hypothetical protein
LETLGQKFLNRLKRQSHHLHSLLCAYTRDNADCCYVLRTMLWQLNNQRQYAWTVHTLVFWIVAPLCLLPDLKKKHFSVQKMLHIPKRSGPECRSRGQISKPVTSR